MVATDSSSQDSFHIQCVVFMQFLEVSPFTLENVLILEINYIAINVFM